jgi:hypothetical protein
MARLLLVLSMTVVEALKGVLGGLRETFAAAGTERDGSYDGMARMTRTCPRLVKIQNRPGTSEAKVRRGNQKRKG